MITLSKQVAELYGIESFTADYNFNGRPFNIKYLHEDSLRCFELAVKYRLTIEPYEDNYCWVAQMCPQIHTTEKYEDHPDRLTAVRVAILKCLVRIKE
jgi:hypothetical protein